jgi:2-aminobenzoate-CoA ligase
MQRMHRERVGAIAMQEKQFESNWDLRTHGRPTLTYGLPELYVGELFNFVETPLEHNANRLGDKAAYFWVKANGAIECFTWRDVRRRVTELSAALTDRDISRGDRVMVGFRECPELMCTLMALLRIGAVPVPFSPMARARELEQFQTNLKVRLVIGDGASTAEFARLREQVDILVHGNVGDSGLEPLDTVKSSSPVTVSTLRNDPAVVFHTSGTTGTPKACLHTHRALAAQVRLVARYNMKVTHDDRLLNVGPATHAFGFIAKIGLALHTGAAAVLFEELSPPAFRAALDKVRITHLIGPTVAWKRFVLSDPDVDVSCVRYIESLPYDEDAFARLRAAGLRPVCPFGMAPMCGYITTADGAEPAGSLGAVLPGYEAYVVSDDPEHCFDEDGTPIELEPGKLGKLAVRGPTGIEYVGCEDYARVDSVRGWSVLDDAFVHDANGYLYWKGRYSNVIKTSGYSVSPLEVEESLHRHPAVARSAVFGMPDEQRGEVVVAVVELARLQQSAASVDEMTCVLQEHVKADISPYKYPRHISFIDTLPVDALGKTNYRQLKDSYLRSIRRDTATISGGAQ